MPVMPVALGGGGILDLHMKTSQLCTQYLVVSRPGSETDRFWEKRLAAPVVSPNTQGRLAMPACPAPTGYFPAPLVPVPGIGVQERNFPSPSSIHSVARSSFSHAWAFAQQQQQ